MKRDPNATAIAGGPQAVRREFDRSVQRQVGLVKPRLVTINAADLSACDFPPVAFVVPSYVAEGPTVIAGRPKTGKSWLALGWAVAVASGGVAFGSIEVEAGDVLYLALEDKSTTAEETDRTNAPRRWQAGASSPDDAMSAARRWRDRGDHRLVPQREAPAP
jgi:hypothetical protein